MRAAGYYDPLEIMIWCGVFALIDTGTMQLCFLCETCVKMKGRRLLRPAKIAFSCGLFAEIEEAQQKCACRVGRGVEMKDRRLL